MYAFNIFVVLKKVYKTLFYYCEKCTEQQAINGIFIIIMYSFINKKVHKVALV